MTTNQMMVVSVSMNLENVGLIVMAESTFDYSADNPIDKPQYSSTREALI